jgi:threonine/homoserine/homoserine lactone efflux protein
MNTDWLAAFLAFAFSTAGTPGPNNMMLAASGATFGLRRTAAHIAGIAIGFPSMIAAVGLGLGEAFRLFPVLQNILKWVGGAYLLWLAWKTATAAGVSPHEERAKERGKPLTFWQAAAFQWVNPKAWTMIMAMMSVYAGRNSDYRTDVILMASMFVAVAFTTALAWALVGVGAGRLLSPARLVWFNRLMAALMAASLVMVWF